MTLRLRGPLFVCLSRSCAPPRPPSPNGAPATEPTEVRIVFSTEAISLEVTCYDSEPDKWLGYETRRDRSFPPTTGSWWTIDTFLDGRSG